MSERSIFASLTREPDGTFCSRHGPYTLRSAFQPIFRQQEGGGLELRAVEGLIRPNSAGETVAPAEFFARLADDDRAAVDSLCRSLHILNARPFASRDLALLVNFQPGLFVTGHAIRQEVERMRLAAHEAGLRPGRIACELRARPDDDPAMLADFAANLHRGGFLVAIDDFAGDDRDMERIDRLGADIAKLDTIWVRRVAENSAGATLLRLAVEQLRRLGTEAVLAGVEETWQLALADEIDRPLVQGYLLGRPELAPTTFDLRYPADDRPGMEARDDDHASAAGPHRLAAAVAVMPFGRKGV
ncbi:EAL domain-containing protein [Rhizobium sp. TRM95111]|uniref:EAL domain-containing protein n=1 Tax=Rhizobium alarense TaxID=2846851 RepID=UPI001F205A8D|nr:EAL domain-containing protein [Rhizobium alarense]MCF3642335.1 EAL domain-containing protein [Rhizobium alarense]